MLHANTNCTESSCQPAWESELGTNEAIKNFEFSLSLTSPWPFLSTYMEQIAAAINLEYLFVEAVSNILEVHARTTVVPHHLGTLAGTPCLMQPPIRRLSLLPQRHDRTRTLTLTWKGTYRDDKMPYV